MDYKDEARIILRQYRVTEDITQEEFTKRVGVSTRSIALIESRKKVKDSTLARALKVAGYELKVIREISPMDNNL